MRLSTTILSFVSVFIVAAPRIAFSSEAAFASAATKNRTEKNPSEKHVAEKPKVSLSNVAQIAVADWPRMRADKFGCLLEKELNYKDGKFNCSLKGYKNVGDPCQNVEIYYEGPSFPKEKTKYVHESLQSIDLSWEHGDLQSVSFIFKGKLTESRALKLLRLPKSGFPSNISRISVQDCSKESTCVLVQGFDHMGSGDVDCSE